MKIQILGSGCASCKNLHKALEEVVQKLSLNIEVEYSTDIAKIVELGAMSSPVLAIDGQLITSGKVPTSQEIETIIQEHQKNDSGCCAGKEASGIECSPTKKEASEDGCSCGENC